MTSESNAPHRESVAAPVVSTTLLVAETVRSPIGLARPGGRTTGVVGDGD